MKIRNSFVSNSSSSSFIISLLGDDDPCPHCGRSDPDFINYITNDCDNDTVLHALGSEEVSEYLCDNIGYCFMKDEDRKEWKLLLDKVEEEEDKGHRVAYISISYHDERCNDEFSNQINNGKIKQLWTDH